MAIIDSIQPQNVATTEAAGGEYSITFEPVHGRVKAKVAGKVVADSQMTMLLTEGRLVPVYYFDRQDVRMDLLHANEKTSHCPFRGNPTYYDIHIDEHQVPSGAWSYESPYPESDYVKDYVAFYADCVDEWLVEKKVEHEKESISSNNPLINWLVLDAWQAQSIADLVARLLQALQAMDVAISRFALITRTLHPQLFGSSYRWEKGSDNVLEGTVGYEVLQSDQYLNSPLLPIFEGAGGVRRRLDNGSTDDFPVLKDIRDAGGTDYVAMPLIYSDGQVNAITLATDVSGGFLTGDLGRINEALPLLARLIEVFAQREKSKTLLTTYLGEQSGQRVLDGLVKRGDGEDIYAVIWFCDLRESSGLAASMTRARFLQHLNAFFDNVVGAVLENKGEVLRFIGDAALAIFPFQELDDKSRKLACQNALAAALDALNSIAKLNAISHDTGLEAIGFGIGLHLGVVTYGNIGTSSRLEFTVIGAAANEAARIESLCKSLGHQVLLSEEFVSACGESHCSVGKHSLRGTQREFELFIPHWSNDQSPL
jgi:adenylate cyclase